MESSATGSSEALAEVTPVAVPSFEEFFQAEHVRLGRALYLLTGSAAEADELSQEAMVRVYERWDRVRQMDSPQGYLFRTALNLHRSRVRWLASRARHMVQPSPSRDPAEVVEGRDSLARALASLPTGQRGAVVLVEWLGMDPQEAAEALGIKPGSVRARLSRARAALRETWEDEDA
ncbi:MAG TPA: sigma-70 family RNA polymerase sigma factor [Actinomycetota bacterium]|nr:sigma-70 family RNA polymerase sigma factor [Actinomycetota bacterium]